MNKEAEGSTGYQFGAFKGVFTPSILTILGVVMYLRFGWALGNVGVAETLLIVTMASGITFLTGLSLSALATNMKVKGGGAYFIISRSLGLEAGAAVGLPLFFAQALGISFYVAGFTEAFIGRFPGFIYRALLSTGISDGFATMAAGYEAQIIGVTVLLLLTILAYISADWALKMQFLIMAAIFVSLVSFFLGGAPETEIPVLNDSPLLPVSFWAVFAVIFPAVTGIEAGIAMSGDLKDPAKSLPLGTISAVLLGYIVYVVIILFLASSITDTSVFLRNDHVMRYVAKWGDLVVLGIWAASLSSALGALLGAPRTLQALARDKVIPRVFGLGFGKGNDPRIATATAFLVALIGIVAGDLNAIGTVLTMFFLTSYGLLNVSAGLEELTAPPSWRPKFKVHWLVSILGACGCFAAMFMIHAGATFVAAFVAAAVFFYMEQRSLKARWGDVRTAALMLLARNVIHKLARRKLDKRTWRPNILVMSGAPTSRWYLVELATAISHERGFLTVAAILPEDTPEDRVSNISSTISDYLDKRDVQALVKVYPSESPLKGAQALVGTYGYGPIAPNTLLLGMTERPENYFDFAKLVQMVGRQKNNLVLVRDSGELNEEEESSEPKDTSEFLGERIVIWWYGTQQNLGLMLALVYLLKRSKGWRDAELILRTVVAPDVDVTAETERLNSFIERTRIDARAEVLQKTGESIFEDIRNNSKDADLVFLGMRAPEEDETTEQYSKYYDNLIRNTKDLPPAAFILASETVDFYGIFQDS